ncbi:MAG: phospholipase [Elusimicrobia bacterium]|nr:phospholipase [Elusimicrobiota bacterium]
MREIAPLAAALAAVLAGAVPARAADAPQPPLDLELVQSAPEGTGLADPQLREAAKVWPEMIDRAGRGIDLEEFYATGQAGEALDATLAALKRAGERGVRIRLLLEGKMRKADADTLPELEKIPNLSVRFLDWAKVQGAGIIHAKFFVVDGREAYIGSQNLDWRSLSQIHEMGLRVSEPSVVAGASSIFAQDWAAAALVADGKPVPALRTAPVEVSSAARVALVASPWAWDPEGVPDSQSALVGLVASAKERLDIQVMEYAPLEYGGGYYPVIDDALRAAAERGVKVNLLVSDWNLSKSELPWLKSFALVPNVTVKVISIPQPKGRFIPYARVAHSKYMVVDGKTLWLGTSNWQGGYMDNSRNLELIVREPALAAEALAVHRRLWDSPFTKALDVSKAYQPPRTH